MSKADGVYESRAELTSPAELVRYYLDLLDASSQEERSRRDKAGETWKIYTGDNGGALNILFSNVETIVPAIFNKLPTSDVYG